jgi:hypothetical protein
MPIFQKDIGDTINLTTFELRVPDDYETTIPGYYQKFPERTPIYQGETDLAYSELPIARIIDMCNSDIPFTIVQVEDVKTIITLLKQYITALRSVTHEAEPDTSPNKVWTRRSQKTLAILEEHGQMATLEVVSKQDYNEAPDLIGLLGQLGGSMF